MTNTGAEPKLEDVLSLFKDHSGDESGGLHAIRGFTFQVWQAVLETLKAHATGKDYAVVLEWQQDIAILDASDKPTKIRFVQLKKNESSHHWTLHALLTAGPDDSSTEQAASAAAEPAAPATPAPTVGGKKKSAAPKQSILAKLYFHRLRFAGAVPTELVFASNAPFYVAADDTPDSEQTFDKVVLADLPTAPMEKLSAALRKQLSVPVAEDLALADFTLEVTNCPTEEAHKFAIGELVEQCSLLNIQPLVTAPFVAVCLIASYINQRAGKRSFAKDFPTLLSRAVTRADITKYFAAANDSHVSTQDLVEKIVERLNLEKADFEMVQEMQAQMTSACAEITNRASPVWPSIEALVRLSKAKDKYKALGDLKDRFPAWLADFRALKLQEAKAFNQGYLYCLMAMIIQNAKSIQHLSAASAGPKPEAEE